MLTSSLSILKTMTDSELVLALDEVASYSPIIKLLCERLEEATKGVTCDAHHKIECPVCQADLIVDYDPDNELFDVRVDKS